MPVIEQKVMINRSASEIYRFIVDFGNNPKWQPNSMQFERAGKVKLGDMIVGMQRIMGRMTHVNADVVEVAPNQRIIYSGVMGGYPFRTTYNLNFSGVGGAEVSISTNIRIPWLHVMFRPFILGDVKGQTTRALNGLKEYLEARRDLA
jgi:hypothetical protein